MGIQGTKSIFKNTVLFFCIGLIFTNEVRPILDGRTTPIYVDTLYTFSDHEWARGAVYFKKGVEVPAGLTAHLAVWPVVNGMNLNGTGRVILEDHLHLIPAFLDTDQVIRRFNLICMEDEFAILHLRGGDLSSSTTGLRLTKGTLFATELCEIRNEGAVAESEGVSFGNGTIADDLNVRIDAGATLEVMSGLLVYDNDE